MPGLYVAVYQARPPKFRHDSEMAAAFCKEVAVSTFPYDTGDDPAFFSAKYHNGPFTWGVCRLDVRCRIRNNDGIVFFAEQKDSLDPKTTYYRFAAALRVAEKMKHTALSKHPLFSQYLNLVIRPCGNGWQHHEPVSKHRDWLWKVTCQSLARSLGLPPKEEKHRDTAGKIHAQKHWEAAGKTHMPGDPLTIGGRSVPVAADYVVFSRSSPVLARNPPLIARHHQGEAQETWENNSASAEIRKLVLRDSGRCLRIRNRLAHRHIVHTNLTESELEETFRALRAALTL